MSDTDQVRAAVDEALAAARAERLQRLRGRVVWGDQTIAAAIKGLRRVPAYPEGEWLAPLIEYLETMQAGEHITIYRRTEPPA